MTETNSSPPGGASPSRGPVFFINVVLLALAVYLGASLLALKGGRMLSPRIAIRAYPVLFTPLNPFWRDFSIPGYARLIEPSVPARSEAPPPRDLVAEADERASEFSASRQFDDASRNRMRDEMAAARQAYDTLMASGRPRDAAIALSPGIAAASRLDDLDSLEALVDLQVDALKGGASQ